VDKTLYSVKPVPVRTAPWDDFEIIRTIAPHQLVGTVYSWAEPKDGRSFLYWEVKDPFGVSAWVPHYPGLYDLESLRAQGLLSITEQDLIDDYPGWYEAGSELISDAGSLALKIGVGFALYQIAKRLI
jgi:hypothetical protein